MIKRVNVRIIESPKEFTKFLRTEDRKKIISLAKKIEGKRIVHLNATAEGGGVAEILKSVIPYLRSLGIQAEWYALDSSKIPKRFFVLADKIRYASQGMEMQMSKDDWDFYKKVSRSFADEFRGVYYDVLVVHDWQPIFMTDYLENKKPRILFYHADTSTPYEPVWKEIVRVMEKYKYILFNNKDFTNNSLPKKKVKLFHGAIDPLLLKQKIVPKKEARCYLQPFGISPDGLLIVQVSRFDVWKNPLGVIDAFKIVQKKHPETQLALAGIEEATDNPAAEGAFKEVEAAAKGVPNVHLFFRKGNIQSIEEFTMMLQNAADIVIQNSIREGFGLTVSEAMWKAKPVIGGPASGIRLQIQNGKDGLIAKSSKELANHIMFLLSHPKERKEMGKRAKETVRKKFLTPSLVCDHLKLYQKVLLKKKRKP